MTMFLEFVSQQWMLVSALAVCVLMLFYHESRRGGKTISPHQLVAMVNAQQAAVIDVRDIKEFRKGHIVDSINIPADKVGERWGEFEQLRERPIILVCNVGQSASAVGKQLAAKGFENVYRLGGGINEWQSSQLPVVKG